MLSAQGLRKKHPFATEVVIDKHDGAGKTVHFELETR